MDHELKQRLIGAVVVTALAAIFIPMLFDDPVDTSGKAVTEVAIPHEPADASPEAAQNLPANKDQVLNRPEIELNASEVNEENQANTTGEAPITNMADGEQTEQSAIADTGSDIPADETVEDSSGKKVGQNKEPTLDTGVVGEGANDRQANTVEATEPEKKSEQIVKTPTTKPVGKPVISEEPKAKPVISAEKPKTVAKNQKDSPHKTSSKLVRYSIQAGSFNKKENAQALVEKLRKQGMPASIVVKGDLYRVKIGPSLDKGKAASMKAKLDKQNVKSILHSE